MNGLGNYTQTSIGTAGKSKLVIILYEGAIKFLNLAVRDIGTGDFEGKNRNICKAIDIISELNITLDMSAGGQISQNLRGLYNFFTRNLKNANIKCDIRMIRQVISCLGELNQGWKAIAG